MMKEMQQVVLARHCDGLPRPSDFRIEACALPEPAAGQFRVRHIWCSVDPGTRSRLSGDSSYAAALRPGQPIDGFCAGIIEASEHPDWTEGTLVYCAGGWRTHSLQSGRGFIGRIPHDAALPLSAWIGVLGVPGLTAWFGLREVASFRPSDRVLITSAAGPVGATAGQLARAWGAQRITGLAGSDEKCDWLLSQAGFDKAINYRSRDDLAAALAEDFPDGIDILFDNVGNAMIDLVLPLMAVNGRICISGQVADYNLGPGEIPGIVNTRPFITHRLRMGGLVVFDYARQFPAALTEMAGMIGAGTLKYQEERFEGIENMPEAFCGLFRGENRGRRVVRVTDPGPV